MRAFFLFTFSLRNPLNRISAKKKLRYFWQLVFTFLQLSFRFIFRTCKMTRLLIRFNIIMALKCEIVFEVHARAQENSAPERIKWIAILSTWICSCVVFDCSIIDGIRCGEREHHEILKFSKTHTSTPVEHQNLTTQPYHLRHYIKVINYLQLRKLISVSQQF